MNKNKIVYGILEGGEVRADMLVNVLDTLNIEYGCYTPKIKEYSSMKMDYDKFLDKVCIGIILKTYLKNGEYYCVLLGNYDLLKCYDLVLVL